MALEQRTALMVPMRIAEKTAKMCETGARAFARFAVFYRFLPVLPATDRALAAFVSFQSHSCTHDTMLGYLSHICFYAMVMSSSQQPPDSLTGRGSELQIIPDQKRGRS